MVLLKAQSTRGIFQFDTAPDNSTIVCRHSACGAGTILSLWFSSAKQWKLISWSYCLQYDRLLAW